MVSGSGWLFWHLEIIQWVAKTAANLGSAHFTVGPGAKSFNFYPPFANAKPTADHRGEQHVFAGIGACNGRYRAILAEVSGPVIGRGFSANQAALFIRLSPVIVAVEIGAFNAIRGAHSL